MSLRDSIKGICYGCLAGICYGTNPLGALHLYKEGLSPETVLSYRFAWAVVILALMLVFRNGLRCAHGLRDIHGSKSDSKNGLMCAVVCFIKSVARKFAVGRRDLGILAVLGVLFAACALTLFASFNYMDAGLASTLLFLYPMEVAVIMGLFFKEKLNLRTLVSILVSMVGIALLYRGGKGGASLSSLGVILVFASSLTYAVYIVVVNRVRPAMGSVKLTFYVMFFCLLCLLLYSAILGSGFPPMPASAAQWGWGFMLGFVPSVLSLVFMAKSVKIVGSTPTAITGALEPLTAVCIGVFVFGEIMTGRLMLGILLILLSVIVLAAKK